MRILPSEEQQIRKEKILQAVVHLYIKTGKPVGSSTILESFRLNLSPASVRNVMADLEKEGFLTHPHTSAGRMPTDKGYRVYVNSIANIQRLAVEEEQRIKSEYSRRMKEIEDLMTSTTRLLSTLSHCTGFALPPKLYEERLRRIELVPIDARHILAILVSDTGLVKNQMISVERVPAEEDVRSASRFLSEKLAGMSFNEADKRLHQELIRFQDQQYARRDFLQLISDHLFDDANQTDLYVEGTSNIYNFPEFHDYESMRNFAQFVDEKESLGKVLLRELNKSGVQVKIGSEVAPQLKDFSVVSTCYNVRGRPVGVLGILGPKRMQYERMMSIVDTVAGLVNRVLEGREDIMSYNLLEAKKHNVR